MAKAGQKKKGETPAVLRCDKLATFMNPGKERDLRAMMRDWREAAGVYSRLQWRCFHQDGRFDPYLDPATQYRKDGGKVRSGTLRRIALRHGIEILEPPPPKEWAKPKKKVLPTPPGLADPLAPLKASLGAAQVQMVQGQVIGTFPVHRFREAWHPEQCPRHAGRPARRARYRGAGRSGRPEDVQSAFRGVGGRGEVIGGGGVNADFA